MRQVRHLIILLPLLFLNSCFVVYDFDEEPDKTAVCGDGILDSNEECDGATFNGQTCVDQGFINGGTLLCNVDCLVDTSNCIPDFCGNGVFDETLGEECDGVLYGSQTCVSRGFSGGFLDCSSSCHIDDSDCTDGCTPDSVYADSLPTCDTGEVCRFTSEDTAGCSESTGASGYYETCNEDFDCPVGSGCIQFFQDISFCSPYCEANIDHFLDRNCPPYDPHGSGVSLGECVQLSGASGPIFSVCALFCEVNNDCTAGEDFTLGCYPLNPQELSQGSLCLQAGDQIAQDPCNKINDCVSGSYCSVGGFCVDW
jgi:hypothetical protein